MESENSSFAHGHSLLPGFQPQVDLPALDSKGQVLISPGLGSASMHCHSPRCHIPQGSNSGPGHVCFFRGSYK